MYILKPIPFHSILTGVVLCTMMTIGLGQVYTYNVQLEPVTIDGFDGIQSFAYGQYGGEWIIIGGRLDGLHQRQPFAAFDEDGHNMQALVVNPTTGQVWRADYDKLSIDLRAQLSATNMQFFQEGDKLILTGGYGYNPKVDDHMTYPSIAIIDLPSFVEEVKVNDISSNSIWTASDESFAVCGGQLDKINDVYYLVGGHRFDGRYNPMGPQHGPGFVQEYTNDIRPFQLTFHTDSVSIELLPRLHDEMHLHRRDYNLLPQLKDGEEALMLFSGVFKNTSNLPWLYPVSISSSGYEPIEDFDQLFNHYHCASLPIYNASEDEMHNLFFGGIAQFYMKDGILVQDNDVPFTQSISDVIRTADDQ